MRKVLDGKFELLAEAARGGMGSVHRAKNLATGGQVAVKIIEISQQFDRARFEREANLLAALSHANIVKYVAHGVTPEGVHYLAQEWVDGITLSTQLQTIGCTARDAVRIAIGVSDALAAAHAHGIVHRDVKPANLILDAGDPDRVKLVDFGIARLAADSGVLTRTGILIGTPWYMAPEQARGSLQIGPGADIWALGCVLYEALTGGRAFRGRTPEAVRAKVLIHEPEPALAECPEAGEGLSALVASMLQKPVASRPSSAAHVARELRRLLPTVADGPSRTLKKPTQASTRILPGRKVDDVRSFALVSVAVDAAPMPMEKIDRISAKHGLKVHVLDEGSLLLEAEQPGRTGALGASYAAFELRQEVFDGAVSLFGQAYQESIDDAIDRGAEALERTKMATMFAAALGGGEEIPVDNLIAELVLESDLTLVTTEDGPALRDRALTGTDE